ncbi:ATP-binding protein [uncultured Tyzzerella sp.]|uniref:ATP-binding protein n=1 Tax=uncultured Tyzzerella sp. TaxID=2321398 RepID=UPI002943A822|nr:ATP-binding protein [uncultured Tyzzerella sp.]
MKSVRFKLIFIYFILVFIVMIVSGTFIIFTIQKQEIAKVEEQLKSFSKAINEQIIDQYEDEDDFQSGFTDLFMKRVFTQNIQGAIIDKDGKTIAGTNFSETQGPYQYKNSVIISALSGKENFNKSKKGLDENSVVKEWLSYGYPVLDDNKNVKYVIYVQIDASNINDTLKQTTNTIGIAVVIALILAVTLGSMFSNTITAPISLLTKKANLLAKGHLEQHIIVRGEDEIGQLTRSFNHMARELRKTVSEMENENNKLEIVLHNMTDGVVAFDEIGSLIHANKEFYELMGLEEEEQYKINLDYFLYKINLPKNQIKLNKNTEISIYEGGKYIEVVLIPYTGKNNFIEGIMIVLKDITRQKKLDDMRKEFVANVSHEIRTPITTIKSYTETLLEGAIEEKELAIDFLNTINEASDRMKFLTDDLLELSRLDGGKISFNFKISNLYDIVLGCVKQNIIIASKKNQQIILKEPNNKNMIVMVDTDRINQVLNNILSNAIKYSYENKNIEIFIEENIDNFIVNIKDNGIGIPKEDIGRIFERFYRVDKARSRAMGGNGLGLSIAKEIMLEHSGDIKAFSKVGEGTTMQVIFKKYRNTDSTLSLNYENQNF